MSRADLQIWENANVLGKCEYYLSFLPIHSIFGMLSVVITPLVL